jgi:hypothetical protein
LNWFADSHKSSTSSSPSGKKRKEDEIDDDNMKQIPKKKKNKICSKKTLDINFFFSIKKYIFSQLYNFCGLMIFFLVKDYTRK